MNSNENITVIAETRRVDMETGEVTEVATIARVEREFNVFAGLPGKSKPRKMTAEQIVARFADFCSVRGDAVETVESLQVGETVIGQSEGKDIQIGRAA